MQKRAIAKIISYNSDMIEMCASAARISTTQGNAINTFSESKSKKSNTTLIEKVIDSGHKSVLEHAVFSIAFNDVSVFVEEYIIECRLASFTVKSRRYVDYSNQGYYIPESLGAKETYLYKEYMNLLFEGYTQLLRLGIPKEDARFLLPYSFCSNFYCTINARELALLLSSIINGRGKRFPELVDLANQLILQIKDLFPAMLSCLSEKQDDQGSTDICTNSINTVLHSLSEAHFINFESLGTIKILQSPQEPLSILKAAHSLSNPLSNSEFKISDILLSSRPRELEQISYTFLISPVSLSSITHLVRHRMQSIIIPQLTCAQLNLFVLPISLEKNQSACELYKNIIDKAVEFRFNHWKNEKLASFYYYYLLSGNVMDIMTTMNARELKHFFMLRSCNRAQWEIRTISINMLSELRSLFPQLFSYYGPSCIMKNYCPEGKLSCGQINQVKELFSHQLSQPKYKEMHY